MQMYENTLKRTNIMHGSEKALVGNIQHFNVHDGNGFRTTVFFQGCNMHCKWCQNPELQSIKPVVVKEEISSKLMSVEEIIEQCIKESFFYKFHGGGVTLSGGEPLIHQKFIAELVKELKKHSINVAIETAGYVDFSAFEKVYKYTDTFLYDIKIISDDKRKNWLGVESRLDLDNIRKLSLIHNSIVVRIPLIPEVNSEHQEYKKILDFIDELKTIHYIHLLPFHHIGDSKYIDIGKGYEMVNNRENTKEEIDWCRKEAIKRGYVVDVGGKGFTYL